MSEREDKSEANFTDLRVEELPPQIAQFVTN